MEEDEADWILTIGGLMRGVGFEPTNPYGMRFPSWISSSERHVGIDLTPLTKLGNPRAIIHLTFIKATEGTLTTNSI